jgi:hypothetical protein
MRSLARPCCPSGRTAFAVYAHLCDYFIARREPDSNRRPRDAQLQNSSFAWIKEKSAAGQTGRRRTYNNFVLLQWENV